MDGGDIEHEICGNCKKEIPHFNYVMHTAHCARNITLCPICKEPIPKNEFEKHKSKHKSNISKVNEKIDFPKQISKSNNITQSTKETVKNVTSSSSYTSSKKGVEQKTENKAPFALRDPPPGKPKEIKTERAQNKSSTEANACYVPPPTNSKTSLLPCKFCDLELPKLDLEGHENYCGARTDKCNVCGEIVMFRYKKLHEDTNHGFLKLNDEPGPRPSWDSNTQRPPEPSYIRRQRPQPIYTVDSFDFSPLYNSYSATSITDNDKKESYKDISRRLDCKTEYIRNLLHDSASITVPLRRSGTAPRNHFYNHDKGPAPQPPHRRPNPPTELLIPCEFCHTPVPHEDLIQHETGCRPDLARFNARRRSPSPDDYFVAPEPTSPEVELPCEFCADMFPASQLLRHQLTCS